MKILSYRRFALWWQLAMDWFQRQFAAIASSIDFSTVNAKIDAVGGKVDTVSGKIDNIHIDTTDLAKDATVAKEAQATLNKQEILSKFSAPFAKANANVLTLHMITLKQMEDLWIRTSAGDVKFTVTTDDNNYYLAFSSDSPQAIAGEDIEEDSVDIYNNEIIFNNEVITFPSGWTIQAVYLEDIVDNNLLDEGDAWRMADIRRAINNIPAPDLSGLATEANATTNKQDILAKIGTPATGQATDLFAAIAEGGSGGGEDAQKLAEFFGVTLLQGYEFMTDTEVTDELEDIMQTLDPELEQEVEYPEGSGTYMTKAQAITAEAMQIINPSQS